MKKTKLLTSLAALALVLGLGACNQPDEETSSEEGGEVTTTDTETPTEGGEGETTIENYKLSFTFTLSEEAATLPSYEALYIAGDFNEWDFDELVENDGAYEFTIPSITVGEHSYKVLLAYTGSPDWNNEIIPAAEDSSNATFTVTEGDTGYSLEFELTKSFEDYLEEITTRTNFKVYFHFTDSTHTETYSIPSYADGYVTGYITSASAWTDYTIGGNTKLVSEEDGTYSVTFASIITGTVTYNIYFEYNSSAVNHDAATAASWNASRSIGGSSNTTMVIPAVGDDAHIDIAVNPADLINDDPVGKCSMTLAIKNTGTYSGTLKYKGSQDSWASEHTLSTSTGDYNYYITLSIDQYTELEFGIFQAGSSWADSLQAPATNSYGIHNNGNDIVIPGTLINTTELLVLFTADCSGFGGNTHVTATDVVVS